MSTFLGRSAIRRRRLFLLALRRPAGGKLIMDRQKGVEREFDEGTQAAQRLSAASRRTSKSSKTRNERPSGSAERRGADTGAHRGTATCEGRRRSRTDKGQGARQVDLLRRSSCGSSATTSDTICPARRNFGRHCVDDPEQRSPRRPFAGRTRRYGAEGSEGESSAGKACGRRAGELRSHLLNQFGRIAKTRRQGTVHPGRRFASSHSCSIAKSW